jgi:REP element-mobilizing transposase RayT
MRDRNRKYFEKSGNTFFVTTTVVGFIELFNDKRICRIIIDNISYYQNRGDFTVIAYVIMPNHIHLILRVAEGFTVSKCKASIKRITSLQIREYLEIKNNHRLLNRLKMASESEVSNPKIWKSRFDCFVITNEKTLCQKIDYIHNNPVKTGMVRRPEDWLYSSAGRYAGRDDCPLEVDNKWRSLIN